MKKYQSHKIVEAGEISHFNGLHVHLVGGETVRVPDNFYARGFPASGDYLVRYEPDGYLSWSPKGAFEAGYKAVD